MTVELDVGQPILLPPGGGEIIGDSEDRRVEILSADDAQGVVVFSVGERELRATPGAWVQIPPGVPRSLAVAGSAEARFLEIRA